MMHLGLVLMYTIISLAVIHHASRANRPQGKPPLSTSPLPIKISKKKKHAPKTNPNPGYSAPNGGGKKGAMKNLSIKHKPSLFKNLTQNSFAGPPPAPEIDRAWGDLLAPMNMRTLGPEELARTGQRSVSLPEGGGNLVWLGVFHQLHCIVSRPPH